MPIYEFKEPSGGKFHILKPGLYYWRLKDHRFGMDDSPNYSGCENLELALELFDPASMDEVAATRSEFIVFHEDRSFVLSNFLYSAGYWSDAKKPSPKEKVDVTRIPFTGMRGACHVQVQPARKNDPPNAQKYNQIRFSWDVKEMGAAGDALDLV